MSPISTRRASPPPNDTCSSHHITIINPSEIDDYRLSDDGGGSGGLVAPGGRQDTDGLVVAGQTVDTGLDQNQAELGVLVLAVALEVLADGDGLDIDTMVVSIHARGMI